MQRRHTPLFSDEELRQPLQTPNKNFSGANQYYHGPTTLISPPAKRVCYDNKSVEKSRWVQENFQFPNQNCVETEWTDRSSQGESWRPKNPIGVASNMSQDVRNSPTSIRSDDSNNRSEGRAASGKNYWHEKRKLEGQSQSSPEKKRGNAGGGRTKKSGKIVVVPERIGLSVRTLGSEFSNCSHRNGNRRRNSKKPEEKKELVQMENDEPADAENKPESEEVVEKEVLEVELQTEDLAKSVTENSGEADVVNLSAEEDIISIESKSEVSQKIDFGEVPKSIFKKALPSTSLTVGISQSSSQISNCSPEVPPLRKFHSIEEDLGIVQAKSAPRYGSLNSLPKITRTSSCPKVSSPVKGLTMNPPSCYNMKELAKIIEKVDKYREEDSKLKRFQMFLPSAFYNPNFSETTIKELYGLFNVSDVRMHFDKDGRRLGSGTMLVREADRNRVKDWVPNRQWKALLMRPLKIRKLPADSKTQVVLQLMFLPIDEDVQEKLTAQFHATCFEQIYDGKGENTYCAIACMPYEDAKNLNAQLNASKPDKPLFKSPVRLLEICDINPE